MSVPRSLHNLSLACILLAGCASAPPPQPEVARALSPSEEAEAIEAAKHHPIATTYERPTQVYASALPSLPVAPAPIPSQPPPPPVQAPPAPRDQVIVVGADPPPGTVSEPVYSAAPNDTVYVVGEAPAPSPHVDVGFYIGAGWPAWGYGYYGYGYPYGYYHHPWVYPPPVVVPPAYWHNHGHYVDHHDNHGHGYYGGGRNFDNRYNGGGYNGRPVAAPRRQVYTAPPSGAARSSTPRTTVRPTPVAPAAPRAVHVAPSAPRGSGGGGFSGGARSMPTHHGVRVR